MIAEAGLVSLFLAALPLLVPLSKKAEGWTVMTDLSPMLAGGILALAGFLFGVLATKIGLPAITGYLLAGIAVGPFTFAVLQEGVVGELSEIITPLALGIIAYLIGGSLSLSTMRDLRRGILLITAFSSVLAMLFVLGAVTFLGPLVLSAEGRDFDFFLTMGILIGAMSLATAPAATIAIIEETRSHGPVTTILLAVVALDDALAVIAYTLGVGIVGFLVGDINSISPGEFFLEELLSIGESIAIGVIFGLVTLRASRFAEGHRRRLALVLGAVAFAAGLADHLGLSIIITNMAFGFVITNLHGTNHDSDLVEVMQEVEDVVFLLFFTLAGAHLDLGLLRSAGPLAVLIVVGRFLGKIVGAWAGATLGRSPPTVRRYLGIALLPKAGVTIGLALLVLETPELADVAVLLVSGVLASTLINELIAPPLAKWALVRAGEAGGSVSPESFSDT